MKEALSKELHDLHRALLSLQTEEECAAFLEDICTVKEMRDLAQRLEVARMLADGEKYKKIEETAGASTVTISRVKRSLDYGSGGYEMVLERLAEKGE